MFTLWLNLFHSAVLFQIHEQKYLQNVNDMQMCAQDKFSYGVFSIKFNLGE